MKAILNRLILIKQLQRRNTLQKILANTGWIFFERIFRMAAGLLISVWIARYLGPEDFGTLNFAQSFVVLFTALATLGLDHVIVREVVQKPNQKNEILGSAFLLRLIGGLLVVAISYGLITQVRPDDYTVHMMVLAMGLGTVFHAFHVINFWFESQISAKYSVLCKSASFVVFFILNALLILLQAPLVMFAVVIGVEMLTVAIFFLIAYSFREGSVFQWKPRIIMMKSLLRDSWPYVLSGIIVMVYTRVDQLMIAAMASDAEVGIYSAAARISEAWFFIPTAIVASVTPVIIEKHTKDYKDYLNKIQSVFDVLVMLGLLVAIPVTFFATPAMTFLYGDDFYQSGVVLSIHIWGAVFAFLGIARRPYILAENLTTFTFATNGFGAIINVLLNLLVIPLYGAMGAAITTVVSQATASYLANGVYKKTRILFVMQTKALLLHSLRKWVSKK